MASSSQTIVPSSKMITLVSSDSDTFEVEESIISQSQTIKHMIEDDCATNAIPLGNVTAKVLAKVIEFCRRHHDPSSSETVSGDMKEFNTEFLQVDQDMLFDLILAANYLDIKGLLDVTCQHVADMMKNKTTGEIRKKFHTINDYTPEEEVDVRNENA